jgi:hypothetical protein
MHDYDVALKAILTRAKGSVLTRLTGLEVMRWHNSELPEVRTRRADLLGETRYGTLVHVELQSTNDPQMPLRMLEYAVAIHRKFGRFPGQLVLYVGRAPLRMDKKITSPGLSFECRIIDIRELESEPLLASPSLADNIISILARLSDEISAVRQILGRIAENDPALRAEAIAELTILAGLRNLGRVVKKESERMPILEDLWDHDLIGPERLLGERTVILSLMRKRFGPVPAWAAERLETLKAAELEKLALRLLDAGSVEDLFD